MAIRSSRWHATTLLLLILAGPAQAQRITLSAQVGDREFPLAADRLPRAFSGPGALTNALPWHSAQPGIEWAEFEARAGALNFPLRIIVVRLQPRALNLRLELRTRANRMTGAWTVDSVADDIAFAVNAGQFKETGPWGWLVMQSYEQRAPGYGPLSAGIALDTTGAVRWLLPAQLPQARRDRAIRFAFQSYPLLLFDNQVPALLGTSRDLDRDHRDARLIFGEQSDGRLLLVLTRYDALHGLVQRVPVGLTVPESVLLAAALGARHAVMLDGGISAQMLLRDGTGELHKWSGLRAVPLALLVRAQAR